MKELIMLCGLPGSGKSTWANEKKAIYGTGCEVVSTDAIRAEMYGDEAIQGNGNAVFAEAYRRIEKGLEFGNGIHTVIFDATNLHKRDRGAFLRRFKNDKISVTLVYFDVSVVNCCLRNKFRNRVVPEKVIKRMYDNRDVPTLDEEFNNFMVVR